MIDRRSSTDQQPDLSGMDYVLEGASIRDRFLAAFILKHNGSFQIPCPPAARPPDSSVPYDMIAFLPDVDEEERLSIEVERTCEPLTVQVLDDWFSADDDDM